MTNDKDTAASKEDIRGLMEQMGIYYARTEEQLAGMKEEMAEWKEDVIHQFKVIAEDLRHDLIGTHKDKVEDHEDRLFRLERHTGLRTA